jgi:hypothetical protein
MLGSIKPETIGRVEHSLVIGSLDAEYVAICVLGRAHPGAADYWDGNWVRSMINLRVGGFTADVTADLRTEEFRRFADGLKFINDTLSGSAVLTSMEDWIDLTVRHKPNGGLEVSDVVIDRPGVGNQLAFELHGFDQTHVAPWLSQLTEIERAFPVVGRP